MSKIKQSFTASVVLAYVYLASGLIVNVLQMCVLPLWYMGFRDLYRSLIIKLNYLNWCLIPGIAQWWSNTDVNIIARVEDYEKFGKEKVIAILNHTFQLDWVISWIVSDNCNILGNAKCMVKQILRYVPVMGWGWWFSEYIFLRRSLEKDKSTLDRAFKNIATFLQPYWLLIFCEGTRFTPEKHKKSQEYAIKQGLKPLKYHLMPRTKGFYLVAQGMRDDVTSVYDATVCYHGPVAPTLMGLVKGKRSGGDFLVRRIPIDQIPRDEKECNEYLLEIYQEKDRVAEYHTKHDHFPIGGVPGFEEYNDHVTIKLPKNKVSLFIIIMWFVVTLVPLFYYIFNILFVSSWMHIAIFTFVTAFVVGIFYTMLDMGKPKTA